MGGGGGGVSSVSTINDVCLAGMYILGAHLSKKILHVIWISRM